MRQSTSRSVHTIILYAAAAVVLLVVSGCRTMTTGPVTGMPAPGRPAGSEWVVGTPITAYYHGPGGGHDRWGPLTHGMAKKLADGGFTLVWGSSMEDLDVAHAHGLRVTMLASQQLNRRPTTKGRIIAKKINSLKAADRRNPRRADRVRRARGIRV